jgi:hypothetical protein
VYCHSHDTASLPHNEKCHYQLSYDPRRESLSKKRKSLSVFDLHAGSGNRVGESGNVEE